MTGKEESRERILREVKARRDRMIRFDAYPDDGGPITWFVAYRGKCGWSACRGNGKWMDEPSDDAVEWAIEEGADEVQVVDRSELPEAVPL